MNRYIFALILLVIAGSSFAYTEELPPQSVQTYKHLKLGEKILGFTGVSEAGTTFGPATPDGDFFIHFVSDQLPTMYVDDEFGEIGLKITQLGGHLIGGGDGKYAAIFGVDMIPSKTWKLSDSLIVVANSEGEIIGIYPQTDLRIVEAILASLQSQGHISSEGAGSNIKQCDIE